MDIVIKKMETDEEKRGKAYVHWKSWQEAYPGMVSQEYLDNLSLDSCIKMAYQYPDNIYVAKDGYRVVGFVAYGKGRWEEDLTDHGEISAIYVLSEYYGTGVGERLMRTGLDEVSEYPKVAVLVLKDNVRAISFYEKFGFKHDGKVIADETLRTEEIRMIMER